MNEDKVLPLCYGHASSPCSILGMRSGQDLTAYVSEIAQVRIKLKLFVLLSHSDDGKTEACLCFYLFVFVYNFARDE